MNIAPFPGFSGFEHSKRRSQWIADNLCGVVSDALISRMMSEGTISWNRSGGRPSSHYDHAITRVVRLLGEGVKEEDIPFPNVEWNAQDIAKREGREYIDAELNV